MWNVECWMLDVEGWMWDVECLMWDVGIKQCRFSFDRHLAS